MPQAYLDKLKPKYVVPLGMMKNSINNLVAYLCHDSNKETGSIFEVAAGYIAKLRWQRN